jgi:Pyridoxamine 5'-phosphate oxidase
VDKLQTVTAFLESLRGREGAAPRADLLTDDAIFQTLGRVAGRDAVIARLTDVRAGQLFRDAAWSPPEAAGDAVRITGKLPPGGPSAGAIVTVEFAGGRIAAIKQQPLYGAAPLPATPVKLTSDIRALVDSAWANRHPIIVAFVGPDGQPILSFRGSTQSFSDDQLAIWVRNSDGLFLDSLEANPRVALMYRDEDTKATYQFQGRAHVSNDQAARRQIYDRMTEGERNHDYAMTGVALIIDLDRVEGWGGMSPDGPVNRVRMLRNPE